mgnify:CR=1 FL=1
MLLEIDASLVDWSRAQFALTAMYHWLFVPITLGLSFIIAMMETIYVKTGNEEWKRITKFWMKLFGINFAIGVATGLIMEFEFGTNWSNYSWYVGDIFGAPLAIEGIFAFFLESTFIAIMYFGWEKVSKKFHLLSTWLVAFGASLSALWILVANAWMQYPVGMEFNPDTGRSEMVDFWSVLLSPVAVNKFLHTVSSGYLTGALFVIAVSSYYLLKKRDILLAKRSMVVASVFGIIAALFLAFTGDGSAYQVAQKQPAKLAAMEGLYSGTKNAGLTAIGVLKPGAGSGRIEDDYYFKWDIPDMLSLLGYRDANAYVPGVNDIIYGNPEQKILPAENKMMLGKIAIMSLDQYREAKKAGDQKAADSLREVMMQNYQYIGYGYLEKPQDVIPNVPLTFYSFRIMVMLGAWFILLFAILLWFLIRDRLDNKKLVLKLAVLTFPLAFIASWAGWIVAEVGRQPWAIQDLLPVSVATSQISSGAVMTTFILFAVLFTALLIAEIKIMWTAIKQGPKGGNHV